MPMDGFTLGLIAKDLNASLSGSRVDKITQPEPDELILTIRSPGITQNLLLSANAGAARIQLTAQKRANPLEPPAFCMLLRKRIAGSRINRIVQYRGDRIIDIVFDSMDELGDKCEMTITCECMGRHSNLIFYDQNGRIVDSARRVPMDISSVRQVLPGLLYERPPLQDKLRRDPLSSEDLQERLQGAAGLLRKAFARHIMGLSEQTAEELAAYAAGDAEALVEDCDLVSTCHHASEWLAHAATLLEPTVYYSSDGMPADVCPFPYSTRSHLEKRSFATMGEAMDAFYGAKDDLIRIQQKATALRHLLRRNTERCEKKLAIRLQTLKEAERMEEYRIKGELLTAAISQIPRGAKVVTLQNWYDENCASIDIALDETISPARNAQRYFKLYQKMRNAAHLAQEQAEETRTELEYLEGQMENLKKSADEADLQEIRTELEHQGYVRANHNRRQKKALPDSKPMLFRTDSGIEVAIGKNNVQNERLTFSASPNEIWMHVKDMPGSHVILRSQEPDDLSVKQAAMLAAYYSKGEASSNVPVDMTLRRYVKKPAGSKPGFVTFTHQTTIYVTPSEELARRLRIEDTSS